MVELDNKYQIGEKRFGINWVGAYTLYLKETLRFLSVFGQTIVGPVVTSILFLSVISLAIGEDRQNVLGVTFIEFLAPGLIAMQIIQQSFSHSSSSLLMGKVMGNIVDLIGAPLSATEVTLAVILASVTRALMIAVISIIIFSLMIEIQIKNYLIFFTYLFLSSFIMGAVGFIAGLTAPSGKTRGHAGAIISGGKGSAEDKIEKMKSCGIKISNSPAKLGKTLEAELAR